MLKLILFVLPLGLDTLAVSAALGMRGLPKRQRLRISLLMSGFEMATPVVVWGAKTRSVCKFPVSGAQVKVLVPRAQAIT